jgi:branched-chain amino acid transport system permease protein
MVTDTLVRIGALTIDGLSLGFLYAMFGLGITLVFGLGGVLNLALGIFAVLALLLTFSLTGGGVPVVLAAILAIAITAAVGLALERSLLQLVYRSEGDERLLLGIFTTLGLSIAIQGVLSLRYAGEFAVPVETGSFQVFGAFIRGSSIVIIVLSLVTLVAMYLFFSRTYTGLATRTIMQDETGAVFCGIDTRRMRTFVFVLSIGIAAFAGVLYGLSFETNVAGAFTLTINAVIVSIVGGVTSILGVVFAGIGLGVLTTFLSAYMGSYISSVALFGAAIIVLVVKPEGIQ